MERRHVNRGTNSRNDSTSCIINSSESFLYRERSCGTRSSRDDDACSQYKESNWLSSQVNNFCFQDKE